MKSKRCRMLSLPRGVILKTVPHPLGTGLRNDRATLQRRPVEVPVCALDKPDRSTAIFFEVVNRGQVAFPGDLEERTSAVGPASGSCPVEVPVGGLHQRSIGP